MMQIDCPFCGRRDEAEFSYGGEAHITRPTLDVDDATWTEYLFFRGNIKGVHAERWCHIRGCGQWFNAVRNTATHQFLAVYRITEPRPAMRLESTLDSGATKSPELKLGEPAATATESC